MPRTPPRRAPLSVERLESRDTPAAGADGFLAVGADAGGIPEVRLLNVSDGSVRASFLAYDVSFRGGVRVAVGDVTGDGKLEVVTAPGPGGGPDVRVFDPATGRLIESFSAYDPNYRGGVNVDVGRLDGRTVIVTGSGLGGGPHVRAFDGPTLAPVASFFAYDPSFPGGVTVAVGDVLGDGRGQIVTGAGVGGGPHVKVFSADGTERQGFYAYDPSFRGGVVVAAGDVAGLGRDAVVTGAGPGGGPQVNVTDAVTGRNVSSFFAYTDSFRGGVNVAVVDGGPGKPDTLVTGAGVGGGPQVNVYDPYRYGYGGYGGYGYGGYGYFNPLSFYAYPAFFTGGLAFGGGYGVYAPLAPYFSPLFGPGWYYDSFAAPVFLTDTVVPTPTYFTDPVPVEPGPAAPYDPNVPQPISADADPAVDTASGDPYYDDPYYYDDGYYGFDDGFYGFDGGFGGFDGGFGDDF